LQIVLRTSCFGDNEVRWSMERLAAVPGGASGASDDAVASREDGAA
jgi:hypothetical protein